MRTDITAEYEMAELGTAIQRLGVAVVRFGRLFLVGSLGLAGVRRV